MSSAWARGPPAGLTPSGESAGPVSLTVADPVVDTFENRPPSCEQAAPETGRKMASTAAWFARDGQVKKHLALGLTRLRRGLEESITFKSKMDRHVCRIELPYADCPFVEGTARKKKEAESAAVLRACAVLDNRGDLKGALEHIPAELSHELHKIGKSIASPSPPPPAPVVDATAKVVAPKSSLQCSAPVWPSLPTGQQTRAESANPSSITAKSTPVFATDSIVGPALASDSLHAPSPALSGSAVASAAPAVEAAKDSPSKVEEATCPVSSLAIAQAAAALQMPVTRRQEGLWYSEAPKQFFFNAYQNNRWAHPVYTTHWSKERKCYQCTVPLPHEVSVLLTGDTGATAKGEASDRKQAESCTAFHGCSILETLNMLRRNAHTNGNNSTTAKQDADNNTSSSSSGRGRGESIANDSRSSRSNSGSVRSSNGTTSTAERAWYADTPKQWFFNCCQNNRWAIPDFKVDPKARSSGGAVVCRMQLPREVVRRLASEAKEQRGTGPWGSAGIPPSGQLTGAGACKKDAELAAALEACRLLDHLGLLTRRTGNGGRTSSSSSNGGNSSNGNGSGSGSGGRNTDNNSSNSSSSSSRGPGHLWTSQSSLKGNVLAAEAAQGGVGNAAFVAAVPPLLETPFAYRFPFPHGVGLGISSHGSSRLSSGGSSSSFAKNGEAKSKNNTSAASLGVPLAGGEVAALDAMWTPEQASKVHHELHRALGTKWGRCLRPLPPQPYQSLNRVLQEPSQSPMRPLALRQGLSLTGAVNCEGNVNNSSASGRSPPLPLGLLSAPWLRQPHRGRSGASLVGDAALLSLQATNASAREKTVEKRLLDYHEGRLKADQRTSGTLAVSLPAATAPVLCEEEYLDGMRQETLRSLPAWTVRESFLSAFAAASKHASDTSAAVLVSGGQGCGKSVVVPLLLLDEALRRGAAQAPKDVNSTDVDNSGGVHGSSIYEVRSTLIVVVVECSLVAATSAQHAARLRGEEVGDSVGWAHLADGVSPRAPAALLFVSAEDAARRLSISCNEGDDGGNTSSKRAFLGRVSCWVLDALSAGRSIYADVFLAIAKERLHRQQTAAAAIGAGWSPGASRCGPTTVFLVDSSMAMSLRTYLDLPAATLSHVEVPQQASIGSNIAKEWYLEDLLSKAEVPPSLVGARPHVPSGSDWAQRAPAPKGVEAHPVVGEEHVYGSIGGSPGQGKDKEASEADKIEGQDEMVSPALMVHLVMHCLKKLQPKPNNAWKIPSPREALQWQLAVVFAESPSAADYLAAHLRLFVQPLGYHTCVAVHEGSSLADVAAAFGEPCGPHDGSTATSLDEQRNTHAATAPATAPASAGVAATPPSTVGVVPRKRLVVCGGRMCDWALQLQGAWFVVDCGRTLQPVRLPCGTWAQASDWATEACVRRRSAMATGGDPTTTTMTNTSAAGRSGGSTKCGGTSSGSGGGAIVARLFTRARRAKLLQSPPAWQRYTSIGLDDSCLAAAARQAFASAAAAATSSPTSKHEEDDQGEAVGSGAACALEPRFLPFVHTLWGVQGATFGQDHPQAPPLSPQSTTARASVGLRQRTVHDKLLAAAVEASEDRLSTLGLLDRRKREPLTATGWGVLGLPVHCSHGKMLLASLALGCLDPVLTIVAAREARSSLFLPPAAAKSLRTARAAAHPSKTEAEKTAKAKLSRKAALDGEVAVWAARRKLGQGACSDHYLIVRAFNGYQHHLRLPAQPLPCTEDEAPRQPVSRTEKCNRSSASNSSTSSSGGYSSSPRSCNQLAAQEFCDRFLLDASSLSRLSEAKERLACAVLNGSGGSCMLSHPSPPSEPRSGKVYQSPTKDGAGHHLDGKGSGNDAEDGEEEVGSDDGMDLFGISEILDVTPPRQRTRTQSFSSSSGTNTRGSSSGSPKSSLPSMEEADAPTLAFASRHARNMAAVKAAVAAGLTPNTFRASLRAPDPSPLHEGSNGGVSNSRGSSSGMVSSRAPSVPSPPVLVQTANNRDLALARDSTVELPALANIGGNGNANHVNITDSSSSSTGNSTSSTTSEASPATAHRPAVWGVCDSFEVDAWDRRLRATGCSVISPLTLFIVNSAHPMAYAAPIASAHQGNTSTHQGHTNSSSSSNCGSAHSGPIGLVSDKWITATCGSSTITDNSGAVAAEAVPRLHAAFLTMLAALARNGAVQGSRTDLPLGFGLASCADADVAQLTDALAQLLAIELEASEAKPLGTRSGGGGGGAIPDTSASIKSSATPLTAPGAAPPKAVEVAALPPPFASLTDMGHADASARAASATAATTATSAWDAFAPCSTLSARLHDSRSSYGSYGSSSSADDDDSGQGVAFGFDFRGSAHALSGPSRHATTGVFSGFDASILGSSLPFGQNPFNDCSNFAADSFGRSQGDNPLGALEMSVPSLAGDCYSLTDLLLKPSTGATAAAEAAPVLSGGTGALSSQASSALSAGTRSAPPSSLPVSPLVEGATPWRAGSGLSPGAHEFRPTAGLTASQFAAPDSAGPSILSPEVAAWAPKNGADAGAGAVAKGGKTLYHSESKAEGNWNRSNEVSPRKSLAKPPGLYSMW